MRPGRCFGVVLHREKRVAAAAKSLQGVVVEVDMGNLDILVFQGIGIHGESVILGGDFDAPAGQMFDGLVGPPVTEF